MKITKIGHCCLFIETKGKYILTDPGAFYEIPNLPGLDLICITHEHADHLHVPALLELKKQFPHVHIITNTSVGLILEREEISFEQTDKGANTYFQDILIESFDGVHEEIIEDFGLVQNTGYRIDETLFYPGDSYIIPHGEVPILALPIAGPWLKISDAIKYARTLKPKHVFPVHDALLNERGFLSHCTHVQRELEKEGIKFIPLKEDNSFEL